MSQRPSLNRRRFLKASSAMLGASLLSGSVVRAAGFTSANDRPRIGVVGTGSRWDQRATIAQNTYGLGKEFPKFGDIVTVVSRVEKFGNTSFVAAHEFVLPDALEPVARGSEVRVWAHADPEDDKKMIARPVPDAVRALLGVDRTVEIVI